MNNKPSRQMIQYISEVLDNPERHEIVDRIYMRLMKSFRVSGSLEREELVKLMDSLELFFDECEIIRSESIELYTPTEEGKI